jgi:hypothetical protein
MNAHQRRKARRVRGSKLQSTTLTALRKATNVIPNPDWWESLNRATHVEVVNPEFRRVDLNARVVFHVALDQITPAMLKEAAHELASATHNSSKR